MPTKSEYINRVLLIMNEPTLLSGTGFTFSGADNAQVDKHIEGSFVDSWRRCISVLPKSWFKSASFKYNPIVPNLSQGTGYVVLPEDFYMMNSFKMQGWQKSIYETATENERTASIQSNEYTRGSQIRPVGTISSNEIDYTLCDAINVGTIVPPNINIAANKIFRVGTNLYRLNSTALLYVVWNLNGSLIDFKVGDLLYYNNKIFSCLLQSTQTFPEATPTDWIEINPIILPNGIIPVLNYYSLQKGLTSHIIEEALYIPSVKPLSDFGINDDLGIDQRILEPLAYLSASTVFTIFEKYDIAKNLEMRVAEMFPGFKSQVGSMITIKQ